MKADTKTLEVLFGIIKKIIIPSYQRNYSWTEDVAKQLLDDVLEINDKDKTFKHFIGPIVSVIHNSESSCRILIDGQQRLTTLLILLVALKNLVKQNKIEVKNKENFISEIEKHFLINEFKEGEERIKLKPYNKDNENFLSLFDESFNSNNNTALIKNYLMFKNKIQELFDDYLNIDELFNTIKTRIVFVDIELEANSTDNAQEIFESLNSKGQDLTNSDLIRNLILMRREEKEQEEIYRNYWEKIENNVGINRVDKFIRDYLIYGINRYDTKNSPKEKGTDIYKKFKYFMKEKDLYDVLRELLRFSTYYKIILNSEFERLKIINELEIGVSYPFILWMFELKHNNFIKENTVIEALKIIENYVFRRYICDSATNILASVFYNLKADIIDIGEIDDENFIDKMSFVLLNKSGNAYFPKDEDFKNNLKNKIFNGNKKLKIAFLFRELEQFNNKEVINFSNLTLEHIIPQTLTNDWKKYLGFDWEELHDKYLWNIGNLTYTGYNSEMSNKPYYLKKPYYVNSGLSLNRDLPDDFKEKNILDRAEKISEVACKKWKLPKTSISLKNKKDFCTLYDDWTSEKPESFIFLDTKYEKNSWLDLLREIIELLLELDKEKMIDFIENKKTTYLDFGIFKTRENLINKDNNIYSYPMAANVIKVVLQSLFEHYELMEDDLKIFIK